MDRQHLSKKIEMKIPVSILYLLGAITGVIFSCKNLSDNNFQEPAANQKGFLTLTGRACYFADSDSLENKLQIKIDTPSCREIEQIESIMEILTMPWQR
jgi:hypothetical protein